MQSMTGFGRGEGNLGASQITIEVKSVNHRYLDTRFRMPGFLSLFELPLAKKLRARFNRGSFDISIRHKLLVGETASLTGTRFVVDIKAAESLITGYRDLAKRFSLPEAKPTLDMLLSAGKVFVPVEDTQGLEESQSEIEALFSRTLDELEQSRKAEGEKLQAILKAGVVELSKLADSIEIWAPKQGPAIQEKLNKRMSALKTSQPVDAERLEWEIAFYADRSDFQEEIDRLRLLVNEFSARLEDKGTQGRRLDFLTQEMHRELNTTGSKATLAEITQLVVEGKSHVEKLRQQVQNVE